MVRIFFFVEEFVGKFVHIHIIVGVRDEGVG
jgi:hypothetical protein